MGAYYSSQQAADFLCRWAIRSPADCVFDPSFGGGVMLQVAARYLAADGSRQLFGAEVDAVSFAYHQPQLKQTLPDCQLIQDDFFNINPAELPAFDVLIGNPPYIRFQRFYKQSRDKALVRAREQGVRLNKFTNAWAAFLIHSCAFLKPGGRLAMIVPAEIGHAGYARPVLQYLKDTFRSLTLLSFSTPLFPEIHQDTVLLLADDKAQPHEAFYAQHFDGLASVGEPFESLHLERLPLDAFIRGEQSLRHFRLPAKSRELYEHLKLHEKVRSLGDLAIITTGYVTGANTFFHVSPEQAQRLKLADNYLRPALFRSKVLRGTCFTHADYQQACQQGHAGHLVYINDPPGKDVLPYIQHGETNNVHQGFKCRTRTPWYHVPNVTTPQLILSYMNSKRPQLVRNQAHVALPNSLYCANTKAPYTPEQLSALWQSSLTSLSLELEGHTLGGGMLKLELREAQQVLVAAPLIGVDALSVELDGLLREGCVDEARSRADALLLGQGLGLSADEITLLREAAALLQRSREFRTGGCSRLALQPGRLQPWLDN